MENKDRRKESAGGKAWARPVVKPAVLVLLAVILLCGVLAGLLWWRRHGADEGVAIRPERASRGDRGDLLPEGPAVG